MHLSAQTRPSARRPPPTTCRIAAPTSSYPPKKQAAHPSIRWARRLPKRPPRPASPSARGSAPFRTPAPRSTRPEISMSPPEQTDGWVTRYVGIQATETNEANGPPGDPTNQIFVGRTGRSAHESEHEHVPRLEPSQRGRLCADTTAGGFRAARVGGRRKLDRGMADRSRRIRLVQHSISRPTSVTTTTYRAGPPSRAGNTTNTAATKAAPPTTTTWPPER